MIIKRHIRIESNDWTTNLTIDFGDLPGIELMPYECIIPIEESTEEHIPFIFFSPPNKIIYEICYAGNGFIALRASSAIHINIEYLLLKHYSEELEDKEFNRINEADRISIKATVEQELEEAKELNKV